MLCFHEWLGLIERLDALFDYFSGLMSREVSIEAFETNMSASPRIRRLPTHDYGRESAPYD